MAIPRAQLRLRPSPLGGKPRACVPVSHAPRARAPKNLVEPGESPFLERRLAMLLEQLDELLDQPLDIDRTPKWDTIRLFKYSGYRVSRTARNVLPIECLPSGIVPVPRNVELLHPLTTPAYLVPVVRGFGFSERVRQGHIVISEQEISWDENWLAERAHRALLRDARFRRLRRIALPAALNLDRQLVGIALAARTTVRGASLSSEVFNLVWRRETQFRAIARENPQLLPLAYAAAHDALLSEAGDPVQDLQRLLREAGLTRAAWRYLAKRGARVLRPAWEASDGRSLLGPAIEYLRVLDETGLPPPPSPRFARELFFRAPRFERDWCPIPRPILGIALRKAQQLRGSHYYQEFIEDLSGVADWGARERPRLDKLQRRAGWPWLVRAAREWEKRESMIDGTNPNPWDAPLQVFDSGAWQLVALTSVEAMADEGLALHNCVARMIGECQLGRTLVYSVRRRSDGMRVGAIKLSHYEKSGAWAVGQVRGPANRPVPRGVWRAAMRLVNACNGGHGPK